MRRFLPLALFVSLFASGQTVVTVTNTVQQTTTARPGTNIPGRGYYGPYQLTRQSITDLPSFGPGYYQTTILCGDIANSTRCGDVNNFGPYGTSGFFNGATYEVATGAGGGGTAVGETGTVLSTDPNINLTTSSVTIASNVVTFASTNTLSGGETLHIFNCGTNGFLNNALLVVNSSGLTGSSWAANYTHGNVSTVSDSCQGNRGPVLHLSAMSPNAISLNDSIILRTTSSANSPTQGWFTGGGTYTRDTTDLPIPTWPGSRPVAGAVEVNALGTTGHLNVAWDANVGGHYYRNFKTGKASVYLKLKSGSTTGASINVFRNGGPSYLAQSMTLTTGSWVAFGPYSFTANETYTAGSPPPGNGQFEIDFNNQDVLVAAPQLIEDATGGNVTAYRDDVVNDLIGLNPGSIRVMTGSEYGIGNIYDAVGTPDYVRNPAGFSPQNTTVGTEELGWFEFLGLCKYVESQTSDGKLIPLITMPSGAPIAFYQGLVDYLEDNAGSTTMGAYRIAQGQTAAWDTVFPQIQLELGNEVWNSGGAYAGENYVGTSRQYGERAQHVYRAMQAMPTYNAAKITLIASTQWVGWNGNWGDVIGACAACNATDMGIYRWNGYVNSDPTIYTDIYAESQYLNQSSDPGGTQHNHNWQGSQKAIALGVKTLAYEANSNSEASPGTTTQTQMTQVVGGVAGGLSEATNELAALGLGLVGYNVFTYPDVGQSAGSLTVPIWGTIIDAGGPYTTSGGKRPTYYDEQMVAKSILPNQLTVTTSGSPTFTAQKNPSTGYLPASPNSYTANTVEAWAYSDGAGAVNTVITCEDPVNPCTVTFAGANAPTGTLTQLQFTSTNPTDCNEISAACSGFTLPTTTSLTSFNPAVGLTLPPFSITTLKQTGGTPTAATPSFSPVAGGYGPSQSVTIATTTAGATLCYTIDGSTPLASTPGTCSHGTTYSGAVTVAVSLTINAIATESGFLNSFVGTAAYVINGSAAAPTFSPVAGTYGSAQSVVLSSTTPGVALCYTVDGSTPLASTPGTCSHGTTYSGAVTVASSETINAIATEAGWVNSSVGSAAYVIVAAAAAPTFAPGAGGYGPAQNVVISTATGGATLCYTIDGSTPLASTPGTCSHGTTYAGAVTVSVSETIKAIATESGFANSSVSSATYVINGSAAPPSFLPAAGSYSSTQSVVISTITSGAAICYTIDGSTPLAATAGFCSHGSTYAGAVSVAVSETINAIATKTGFTNSSVSSAAYVINGAIAAPSFAPIGGTYLGPQLITISSVTGGVTLCYTVDGSTPLAATPGTCSHGTTYAGAVSVVISETIKAVATKAGFVNSSVSSASYIITAITAYYVSRSTGSDSNNGASSATPWQTIGKVNSTALAPGTTVNFKGGDVWHEQLTIGNDGSVGNPITFTSYGSGQAIIDGSDPVSGWTVQSGATYQAAYTPTAVKGYVDANAPYVPATPLSLQTSIANVNATAGSIYSDGTNVYVHLVDGSSPASHTVEVAGSRGWAIQGNAHSYVTIDGLEWIRANKSGYISIATVDNSGGNITNRNNIIRNFTVFNVGNLSNNWTGELGQSAILASNAISIPNQTAIPGWQVTNGNISQGDMAGVLYHSGGVSLDGMDTPLIQTLTITNPGAWGVELSTNFGEGACSGGTVDSVNVSGFVGGGFHNIGCPNVTWSNDHVHDGIGTGIGLGSNGIASPSTVAANNTVSNTVIQNIIEGGTGWYNGIDCNGGSTGLVVTGNIITNVAHASLTLELDPAYSGGPPAGCSGATVSGNTFNASANPAIGGWAGPIYISNTSIPSLLICVPGNTYFVNPTYPNGFNYGYTSAGDTTHELDMVTFLATACGVSKAPLSVRGDTKISGTVNMGTH